MAYVRASSVIQEMTENRVRATSMNSIRTKYGVTNIEENMHKPTPGTELKVVIYLMNKIRISK